MKYLYYFLIFTTTLIISTYFLFIWIPKGSLMENYRVKKDIYLYTISLVDSISDGDFRLYKRIDNHYYLTIKDCSRIIHYPEGEIISSCIPLSENEKMLIFEMVYNMKELNVTSISKSNSVKYAQHSFRVGSYFPNTIAEIAIYKQNQDFSLHNNFFKIEDNVFLTTGADY